jgi:hypothetical protein
MLSRWRSWSLNRKKGKGAEKEMTEFAAETGPQRRNKGGILEHISDAEESGKDALAELARQRDQLNRVEAVEAKMDVELSAADRQVSLISWWGVASLWSFNLGMTGPMGVAAPQQGDTQHQHQQQQQDASEDVWEILNKSEIPTDAEVHAYRSLFMPPGSRAAGTKKSAKEAAAKAKTGDEAESESESESESEAEAEAEASERAPGSSRRTGEILGGLARLRHIAGALGEELDAQNDQLARIDARTDSLLAHTKRTSNEVQVQLDE